jgi:subtilisin family serine protease
VTTFGLGPTRSWGAMALVLLWALAATAAPTDAQRRAIRDGVARKVLGRAAADAIEKSEWIRIVVVFAHDRDRAPDLHREAARQRLASDFLPVRRFLRLPVLAGYANARALASLSADPHVVAIDLEGATAVQLAEAVPLVRLDALHAQGRRGAGAKIAMLDTGVDLAHPDLADAIVGQRCFCDDGAAGPAGCCPNGQNEQSDAGSVQDDQGHGTLVAGILTSAGIHAPLGGAPDAQLVVMKVMSSTGTGHLSDMLKGLDWLLVFRPDVSVVNMSLGGALYTGDCDAADAGAMAMAVAVNQLHAAGVLVVAGTGNDGSGTSTILPACVAKAVSVGAVWDGDVGSQTFYGCTDASTAANQIACWSNRSTTTDVFAPGGLITSSRRSGTSIAVAGTSYATPIVSACAAVLAAGHPKATPDQLTRALRTSGVSVVDATNKLSFPRLDCAAANAALDSGQ